MRLTGNPIVTQADERRKMLILENKRKTKGRTIGRIDESGDVRLNRSGGEEEICDVCDCQLRAGRMQINETNELVLECIPRA